MKKDMKSFGLMVVTACLALSLGVTTASFGQEALPQPGEVIDKSNIEKYKHLFPEEFLEAFLEQLDLRETLVILTSDHGNIEDLSVRTHTRNKAMTLLWGSGAQETADSMRSITDVTPAVLRSLKGQTT